MLHSSRMSRIGERMTLRMRGWTLAIKLIIKIEAITPKSNGDVS